MTKRQQLFLLSGCALVLLLELPRAFEQVRADLAGPYADSAAGTGVETASWKPVSDESELTAARERPEGAPLVANR